MSLDEALLEVRRAQGKLSEVRAEFEGKVSAAKAEADAKVQAVVSQARGDLDEVESELRVKEAREAADRAERAAILREKAPDLADLVTDDRMTVDEGLAALQARERQDAMFREKARETAAELDTIPGMVLEAAKSVREARAYSSVSMISLGPRVMNANSPVTAATHAQIEKMTPRPTAIPRPAPVFSASLMVCCASFPHSPMALKSQRAMNPFAIQKKTRNIQPIKPRRRRSINLRAIQEPPPMPL